MFYLQKDIPAIALRGRGGNRTHIAPTLRGIEPHYFASLKHFLITLSLYHTLKGLSRGFFRVALKFFKVLPSIERSFVTPLDNYILLHYGIKINRQNAQIFHEKFVEFYILTKKRRTRAVRRTVQWLRNRKKKAMS